MMLLALMWVLTATAEGMLYADRPPIRLRLRICLLWIVFAVGSGLVVVLVSEEWRLWLLPAILHLYRSVNAARFLRQRLPLPRLNSVTLRGHLWLCAMQAGCLAITWVLLETISGGVVIAGLAAVQLGGALILLRSSLQTWRYSRPVPPSQMYSDRELPTLSILVPARNETEDLQHCLESLVASDYPKLEILVFDDNSTNRRTPEIIRSFAHDGVRFVQGAPPDETRWLAKNQAYERLYEESSGEIVLFCGVDTRFEPGSLRALLAILLSDKKDMISILPLRQAGLRPDMSLIQPMRYYWELCLPRRLFKRPPVLSTCWLIRAAILKQAGGFGAVAHSIAPEAYFARHTVVTDAYEFIRSDEALGISSSKSTGEQYATSVRLRYPQLHRRIELVTITSAGVLGLLLGPIIGLIGTIAFRRSMAYVALWSVCTACLLVTYYLAAVATRLNSGVIAWLIMPLAFGYDIVIQHISLFKYEFSSVEWKGRDVVQPVMQVIPRLPKI